MDIYCHCGEPWDTDSIHDLVTENHERREFTIDGTDDGRFDQFKYDKFFKEARTLFREKGCEAFGSRHSNANPRAGELMGIAEDVMGDDIDGIASMMEDAQALGMFELSED